MMRIARMASLILAFYLLTSAAATAYAECAWVLWGHSFISVKGLTITVDDWILMDTTETRAHCMARLDERVTRAAATSKISEQGESFRVLVPLERKEGVQSFDRLECLPDTVDPGGPRTK